MNQKQTKTEETKKKSFSLKTLWKDRRYRSALLAAGAVLLCGLVYLVLALTVLKPTEEVEVVDTREYVLEKMNYEQIRSIRVTREGTERFCYYQKDGVFYFEGAEEFLYDESADYLSGEVAPDEMTDASSLFSMTDSLKLVMSQLLANQVLGNYSSDLSVYGLDGDGMAKVAYTYVNTSGEEVTSNIIFGDRTPGGDEYYVRVEGKDSVYLVSDIYVTRCIFADLEDYLLPRVALPVSSAEYQMVKELTVTKQGEKFISLRALSEEEREQNGGLFSHVLTYPNSYYPSSEKLTLILENFLDFTGNQVVAYNIAKDIPAEGETWDPQVLQILKDYYLLDSENRWYYQLNCVHEGIDSEIYISRKLEVESETEGEEPKYVYYVYSLAFDVVVEFDAEALSFVEWDLLSYLDNHIFSVNIDNAYSMEFSGEANGKFLLAETGDNLKVTTSSGAAVDTENFRQLFKALLYVTLDGYAEKPEGVASNLKIKVTLRDGKEITYEFFTMTNRKAFYTMDGKGEFYVNRDYVRQLITACNGVLKGETVTVEQKR